MNLNVCPAMYNAELSRALGALNNTADGEASA